MNNLAAMRQRMLEKKKKQPEENLHVQSPSSKQIQPEQSHEQNNERITSNQQQNKDSNSKQISNILHERQSVPDKQGSNQLEIKKVDGNRSSLSALRQKLLEAKISTKKPELVVESSIINKPEVINEERQEQRSELQKQISIEESNNSEQHQNMIEIELSDKNSSNDNQDAQIIKIPMNPLEHHCKKSGKQKKMILKQLYQLRNNIHAIDELVKNILIDQQRSINGNQHNQLNINNSSMTDRRRSEQGTRTEIDKIGEQLNTLREILSKVGY